MSQVTKQDICIQFGHRLRELRSAQGVSQETLADISGLDRTYISGCERGKRNVSLVNIHKLSEALGVELSEFFYLSCKK